MTDKQVDKLANGLWSNLEEARVMDYEGTTLNEQECIAILATALAARERAVWLEAASCCLSLSSSSQTSSRSHRQLSWSKPQR